MGRLAAYSLVLAVSLFPSVLSGQTLRKNIPDLEFARFDRNRIQFRGDSTAFERFFSKMDGVVLSGEGNLRIVHIGGSHVQGGTLTRRLRNGLIAISAAKDGGRGLVFPFTAAKTNTPSSYRSRFEGEWTAEKNTSLRPEKRLGLTGMAVSTSDSTASVRIVLKARNSTLDDPSFKFNTVDILGYSTDGERFPVIVTNSGDTLSVDWMEEDSCWSFYLPESQDSVTVAVGGSRGELTLTGIYLDNLDSGITVSEIGVNGAAVPAFLRCEDFERDFGNVNPDLVIFAIGINDASGKNFTKEEFISRYRTLIRRVRSVSPDCALLFVTNNDSYKRVRRRVYSVNKNGPIAEEAFFCIAEEFGGGVWDMFDIMGGLGSMKDWEEAGLARRDKIHFTDEGYAILGDLMYNALIDKYIEHLRRISWPD